MKKKRVMPVGIQSFKDLREKGFVYVDKSEFIWKLSNTAKVFFLSRPRRFGKSLFLSTLEAYFLGQKELFEGLKISKLEEEQENPWQEYPVLHIDFNTGVYDCKKSLEENFEFFFKIHEEKYGESSIQDIANRFKNLIHNAYKKTGKQVVILVDEYDKPLISTMVDNKELYEEYRRMLKGFYGVIKTCDEYIRFVFLTGVTKFSRVSIFSDLNSLTDISLEREYAEICGITQEELETHFQPEIKQLAERYKYTEEEVLAELKRRYDGYLFSEEGKHVYNPYSLLNTFFGFQFRNYWFATGTPTFLIDLIKAGDYDLRKIGEESTLDSNALFDYRPDTGNPIPIFFQAGYLTIKDFNPRFNSYSLGFPNTEVKQGFFDNLLPAFTAIHKDDSGLFIEKFVTDLEGKRLEAFMERMYTACSGIPYSLASKENVKVREKDYQVAFYVIFTLMGYYVELEMPSRKGRPDLVVQTDDRVYIFEFKLKKSATPQEALQQIKDKGYADKYLQNGKEIVMVGAVFNDDVTPDYDSEDEDALYREFWTVEKI